MRQSIYQTAFNAVAAFALVLGVPAIAQTSSAQLSSSPHLIVSRPLALDWLSIQLTEKLAKVAGDLGPDWAATAILTKWSSFNCSEQNYISEGLLEARRFLSLQAAYYSAVRRANLLTRGISAEVLERLAATTTKDQAEAFEPSLRDDAIAFYRLNSVRRDYEYALRQGSLTHKTSPQCPTLEWNPQELREEVARFDAGRRLAAQFLTQLTARLQQLGASPAGMASPRERTERSLLIAAVVPSAQSVQAEIPICVQMDNQLKGYFVITQFGELKAMTWSRDPQDTAPLEGRDANYVCTPFIRAMRTSMPR